MIMLGTYLVIGLSNEDLISTRLADTLHSLHLYNLVDAHDDHLSYLWKFEWYSASRIGLTCP